MLNSTDVEIYKELSVSNYYANSWSGNLKVWGYYITNMDVLGQELIVTETIQLGKEWGGGNLCLYQLPDICSIRFDKDPIRMYCSLGPSWEVLYL